MKKKVTFFTEASYLAGLIILALGTVFMEKANLGMSMVVAPAYLVYLKISEYWSWFTFGMAEYCLQAVLLILLTLTMRRFRKMYLFSFVTAVLYGLTLDLFMNLLGFISPTGFIGILASFLVGMVLCAIGVSLLFHTYIAPEAYELVVKEISANFHFDIHKTKTVYDCISCAIAVLISFIFYGFGHFEGIKAGTIFCALVNGWLIGRFSKLLEKLFEFKDFRQRTGV